MSRLRLPSIGVALALLPALAAGGCGGSEAGLIPQRTGDRLLSSVEQAEQAAEDERCSAAEAAAQEGLLRAQAMPRRVDAELRRSLIDGFEHLLERLDQECGRAEETPTPTPTDTPEPSPTPTATPSPSPTPSPTPTPSPSPSPTPTETPADGEVEPGTSGGVGTGEER